MDHAARLTMPSIAGSDEGVDDADRIALDRVLDVQPTWSGLERAGDVIEPGGRWLLHAGPPLANPCDACRPLLNSAITAILFEGWATSAEDAETLITSGAVSLHAAQDHDCVVPLADVVSPSMWLQLVSDAGEASRLAYSPLNGGGSHVLRVGVYSTDVLDHLRWINGPFAHALRRTLTVPFHSSTLPTPAWQQATIAMARRRARARCLRRCSVRASRVTQRISACSSCVRRPDFS
jgi:hypothetical protein